MGCESPVLPVVRQTSLLGTPLNDSESAELDEHLVPGRFANPVIRNLVEWLAGLVRVVPGKGSFDIAVRLSSVQGKGINTRKDLRLRILFQEERSDGFKHVIPHDCDLTRHASRLRIEEDGH